MKHYHKPEDIMIYLNVKNVEAFVLVNLHDNHSFLKTYGPAINKITKLLLDPKTSWNYHTMKYYKENFCK